MKFQATIFSAAILLSACGKKPEEEAKHAGAAPQKKSASSSALPTGSADDGEAGPKKVGKSAAREERKRKPQVGTVAKGQPGKVVSPFSKAVVDVGGRKAGELVQDPNFPNDAAKQFEVPEGVEEETKAYKVATEVPGRPGYVFSPYNNSIVDVQGIPAGKMVADPSFPTSEKKYLRVPGTMPDNAPKEAPTEAPAEGE